MIMVPYQYQNFETLLTEQVNANAIAQSRIDDAVVLVSPADIAVDEAGIRTLYVALSRATQRLTTVGTDLDWHP
jgi:DNA helicase IV